LVDHNQKQHSKQQTGLNYVMNIDMTDLEFSLTSTSMSQNNNLTYHI